MSTELALPVAMATEDDDAGDFQLVVTSKAVKWQASAWYTNQDAPKIEWWVDCADDMNTIMEAQYIVNPHANFTIPGNAGGPAGTSGWKINFEDKTQQNLETGKERWIRRIAVLDE